MTDAILSAGGIYAIRNIENGHLYIGSSANLQRRMRAHRSLLDRGIHHSIKLQRAWKRYGDGSFIFEIIERVAIIDTLIAREQFHIDSLNAFGKHGYNMLQFAGSSRGRARPLISDISRERMRAAQLGRKHTDEAKALISAANKGLKRSAEHCAHMSAINIGKKLSAESIEKRSAARRGVKRGPYSEEHRRSISLALAGRTPSKESNEKRSLAMKGRPGAYVMSDEIKEKISSSLMGRPGPRRSDAHKAAISKSLSGRTLSEETKAKLRAAALIRKPANGKPVLMDGEEYPSIKAAADHAGQSLYLIAARIKKGQITYADRKRNTP